MTWWQYLILANLYLALFYGFYALLLRKETFFQLNRVYLVASAVLSFLIPAIQADWVQNLFITQQVKSVIYNSPVIIYQYAATTKQSNISIGEIMAIVYSAGILLLTGRFIWQLMILKKLVSQPQSPVAYTFFKKITISSHLSDNDAISAHEEVHAREWHSADVIIMELIMIMNWFNPIVYLYRNSIKHTHEFIADMQVINGGADKAGYAMLLLNQTLNTASHQLVNPFFNQSFLKKRIIMLQKNRSQRIKLAKYGLSAPLFALMLILSSATVNSSTAITTINRTAEKVFDTPADTPIETVNSNIAKAIKDEIAAARQAAATKTDTVPAKKKAGGKKSTSYSLDQVTVQGAKNQADDNDEVFSEVEHHPEFPGGMKALYEFLGKNIRYPKDARENNIQGRVFLSFIVELDGALSSFKILRGIGHGADEETIRVMALTPKWKPGVQNGRPVRVQYTVPIAFNLSTDDDEKKTGAVKNTEDQLMGKVSDIRVVGYGDSTKNAKFRSGDSSGLEYSVINGKTTNILITSNGKSNGKVTHPLYILDGKEVSPDILKTLDAKADKIASIQVLKDEGATAIYGDKGKNGVILITSKKGK